MRRADDNDPARVRNLYVDVAVGDWVVPSLDGERVEHIVARTSAFTRRASHEGDRFEADVLAANVDVVFLVHALGSPPNQRRLERELVLAFDSGAEPVVLLTKADLVPDPEPTRRELVDVALGVPVLVASGMSGQGVDAIRAYAKGNRTLGVDPTAAGRPHTWFVFADASFRNCAADRASRSAAFLLRS